MVSVLIPAYNESARIAATISSIKTITSDIEIIVVDDGSSDGTGEAADAAGADTVFRQPNSGKGAALTTALRLASGDLIMLIDADLGGTASEARKLLEPVIAGDADMTIAAFPIRPGRGGGAGIVVRLARWGIHALTGRSMAAPLSGQRVLRRTVLDSCGGFAGGWGVEIALTVRALWSGWRVSEVPTSMDHRVTGRSPAAILHRAAQFWAAALVLTRLWFERRRMPVTENRPGNG